MKNTFYIISILLIGMFLFSCNNNSNTESNSDNKNETESAKDSTTTDDVFVSEQHTVKGCFNMVALSTDGAIILFEDEDGNEYEFWDRNEDLIGKDLIMGIEPNTPMHELEDIPFEITYENRMLTFFDGGTGEYNDKEGLVLVEIKSLDDSTDKSKQKSFSTDILSSLTLHGTEPFWSIALYENHAVYNSPEVTDLKMYYLYKFDEDMGFGTLTESIEPQDDGSVSIRIQAEGTSDITRLTISKGECSDGMSENNYNYIVYYQFNDGYKQQGCGNLRTEK